MSEKEYPKLNPPSTELSTSVPTKHEILEMARRKSMPVDPKVAAMNWPLTEEQARDESAWFARKELNAH